MTRILVIDDEKLLLDNISILLEIAEYEVLRAANGIEGLKAAREENPDLILCDVMMPDMSGYEVLSELQQSSKTALIPFIFLTARADRASQRQGMMLGADDYITKPFGDTELLDVVKLRLEKRNLMEKQQWREFSHYLVAMQETERQWFAKELDDNVKQRLVNLKFLVEISQQVPASIAANSFPGMRTLLDELLSKVTDLSSDLHPAMLDHLGLLPTLSWYIERFNKQHNTAIELKYFNFFQRLTPNYELTVYRVLQEVIMEIPNYVANTPVAIVLWLDGQRLHLQLKSAEYHFPELNQIVSNPLFMIINHYLSAVDGDFTIVSTPEDGSYVKISIPNIKFIQETRTANQEPIINVEHDGPTTKVLLAAKDELIMQHLKHVLNNVPKLSMLGWITNFEDILPFNQRTKADVLLIDESEDLYARQNLALVARQIPTILLSAYSDKGYIVDAIKKGIMGYVLKTASIAELPEAINLVVKGKRYFSSTIELSETDLLTYTVDEAHSYNGVLLEDILTAREIEILHLIVADHTHNEIANQLFISPRTVEKHRANIMQKLGLHSHKELILFAVQHGLLSA